MAMKREQARWFLVQDLPKLVDTMNPREETSVSHLIDRLQIWLHADNFWPPNLSSAECSLAICIEKMMAVRDTWCGTDWHGRALYIPADTFQAFANQLLEMCSGICLLCVKAGERNLSKRCEVAEHRVDMTFPTVVTAQSHALL
jgi:hypothetical protein